ncbi:MAG TPA: exodeoxyribonuclease VII small subunit [Nitrospinota bacterium]|nr:exodeoxyribonuclease VII small subunit [Nitrospinota bacterium]|tara:strand:+ start:197986 stop:198249 length:264 start_codon:yes stop_codon:yes gene_type:complete
MADKGNKNKEPNFEISVERLEEIIKELDNGDLELEKSIKLYEEGMKLTSRCQKMLDDAEKKVSKLAKGKGGSFATESIETEDSEAPF